jgi:hypothetical protein
VVFAFSEDQLNLKEVITIMKAMKRFNIENELEKQKARSKGLRIWIDENNRLCIGSDCFHVKAEQDKLTVVVSEGCPVEVQRLSEGQKDKPEESQNK